MTSAFIYRTTRTKPRTRTTPRRARDGEQEWLIWEVRQMDPSRKAAALRAMPVLDLAELYKTLRGE